MMLEYCIYEATSSCMVRLPLIPTPVVLPSTDGVSTQPGKGTIIKEGSDVAVVAAGPFMLYEASEAAGFLSQSDKNISVRVINMPWINFIDKDWLIQVTHDVKAIFVLEDHSTVGGLGDHILNALVGARTLGNRYFEKIGLTQYPECGDSEDILRHHGLDGYSISEKITDIMN